MRYFTMCYIYDRYFKKNKFNNRTTTIPRILMVVPQYPYPVVGGLERQAHELAKALLKQGTEVVVISGKVLLTQPKEEFVEGIKVYRLHWPRQKTIRFLWTSLELLFILYILRHEYDLIHLHQYSWVGLVTILIGRLLKKPIIVKLPNVGKLGLPGLMAQSLGQLKLRILFCADAIIAMSSQSLQELKEAGFPLERVLAIPNGIQNMNISHNSLSQRANNPSIVKVVYVGRLSQEKRIDTLLNAWKIVKDSFDCSAILEIWGTGPLDSVLRQQCIDLCINDTVIFRGYVPDVRLQLPSMDIFVLPSSAEGNSNTILEAMDAGLPIISTRVGGTPMLIGPKGANFLFDVDDVKTIANHMFLLISDSDLRDHVGYEMKERVKRYFSIDNVSNSYINAYYYLVAGQRHNVHKASNPIILEDMYD